MLVRSDSFKSYIDFSFNIHNDNDLLRVKTIKCFNISALLQTLIKNSKHNENDCGFNKLKDTLELDSLKLEYVDLKQITVIRNKLAHVDNYMKAINELNDIDLEDLIKAESYVYGVYDYYYRIGMFSEYIDTDFKFIKEKSELDIVVDKLLPKRTQEKKMKSSAIIQLFLSKMTNEEKETIVDRMFGIKKNSFNSFGLVDINKDEDILKLRE